MFLKFTESDLKVGEIMSEFKKFRETLGLTIAEMAKILGISKSYLEKLETGYKQPSRNVMCKIKANYPQFDMNFFLN